MTTQEIDYVIDDKPYSALVATPEAAATTLPAVMICHAWGGRLDHENEVAQKIADLGYVGVAIDLYGRGIRGSNPEENAKLMNPLKSDRANLQRLLAANLDFVASLPTVDSKRVAAIGYCFGGLCVLDLARTREDLRAACSFHGLLDAPDTTTLDAIKAKVLILHGWDDPMAPPEHVVQIAREMTEKQADWQLHGYGHTVHAFTNKAMTKPGQATVYDANADRRSWQAMQNLLAETLGSP